MQKLRYSLLIFLSAAALAGAQDSNLVFQIGQPDGDYREFAIAGNHAAFGSQFSNDVSFVAGQSDPRLRWPFIQPGPLDDWAGGRRHTFKINFAMPALVSGYYRLVIDFVSTHYSAPPLLAIDVNGTQLRHRLPPGNSDAPLTDPKAGKPCSLEQLLPASLFHSGTNQITLTTAEGSWALFDDLRLESGAPAPAQTVSVHIQPLPWFKRTPEGVRRVLQASVENLAANHAPAELRWSCGAQHGTEAADLVFGHNDLFINVPEVEQKATVEVTIRAGGKETTASATLAPARKWRVFIVPTVHTDIGYTDLQDRVAARHASNTAQALAAADKYPFFKWEFETFWQLDCFLRAHPDRTAEVFQRLREGRMGLSGFFGNLLTGLCSHEALNRSTLSARELANRGGFPLQSVILDDVPSAIGSLPMVLAHSGIKYFIEGVNNDRGPYATQGLKNPFYWEGPDGSRVLSHIAPGYASAQGLISSMAQASERLPGYLAARENADYPYDAVLVNGAFGDNQGVAPWLQDVVEKWNAQWEYPKLILGRPADFFEYLEKNFAGRIPTLKTDFGGWWEDGAASSALETALCRRAEERAVTAEMLHSLSSIVGATPYPRSAFDDLWRNILLYDEHTWGAWCSISDPKSEQTLKQWEVKGSFARKADESSRELLKNGLASLASLAPTADLLVFNPLAWPRKDVVVTETVEAVEDQAARRTSPCQALPEGGSCFVASDLPSVGYRAYRHTTLSLPRKPAVAFAPNQMENEFYRVTLDPRTGALKSVYDKEAKRELVDAESDYGLGELVYVTGGEGTYAVHSDLNLPAPKFTCHRPTATSLKQVNGPVFGELTSEATAEMFPNITLRARLYHGLKRIDLRYELDKKETAAKEAVYIAFPFALAVEKGGLWLEYPDAITQPLKDQHSSACRDWFSVQRWLAASDGNATVVLSPLDTPLITLGGMTGSTWPRQLSLNRAHVFAYAMNNYWHTNYKAEQGGRQVFRFSLTSNRGPFSARNALVQGWDMFCPPVAGSGQAKSKPLLPAAQSLISIQPAGLPLLALKQSEDKTGFALRACDFAGTDGTFKLALPVRPVEVSSCDLVEGKPRKLDARSRTIAVPITRFSPETLKLRFAAQQ